MNWYSQVPLVDLVQVGIPSGVVANWISRRQTLYPKKQKKINHVAFIIGKYCNLIGAQLQYNNCVHKLMVLELPDPFPLAFWGKGSGTARLLYWCFTMPTIDRSFFSHGSVHLAFIATTNTILLSDRSPFAFVWTANL